MVVPGLHIDTYNNNAWVGTPEHSGVAATIDALMRVRILSTEEMWGEEKGCVVDRTAFIDAGVS